MAEILSPAGDMECLKAAVGAGADAVYFGGSVLNARMSASNFDEIGIENAVNYCKIRNVKTYLTLNTVVSDVEMKQLEDYIKFINSVGIDAVIIQNTGLLKVIKSLAPELPVHASTQMTIHNTLGAENAIKDGFERIVLSRELSRDEIKQISVLPVQTEVFIHGALCMCYSGQCYLSSMIGARSGNRGKCAQPCRQPYKNGYELSLKDLCMANNFKEFLSLGVTSFKIEGRLKSPEYVAGVTSVYRRLVDENRNATPDEIKYLEGLFSRQGFTNAYYNANPSKKMFGVRTDEDKQKTREISVDIQEKKLAINIRYNILKDRKTEFIAEYNNITAKIEGDIPQTAKTKGITNADIEKQLSKTGSSPFIATVSGEVDNNLFIAVSQLNAFRRELLEKLENMLYTKTEKPFTEIYPVLKNTKKDEKYFNYHFLNGLKELGDAEKYAKHIWTELKDFKTKEFENQGISLPAVITDLKAVKKVLENAKGIKNILCKTYGQQLLAKEYGFEAVGGFSLNIFNSYDILYMKEHGFKEITVSPELGINSIRNLKSEILLDVIAYGRLPLMITKNCIVKNAGKCGQDYSLKDKTGAEFPVLCGTNHESIILNSVPINISAKTADFENINGFDFIFTIENKVKEIINDFANKKAPQKDFTGGLYYRKV